MWPWSPTSGWYRSIASRTARLPPPVVTNRPPSRIGRGSSPGPDLQLQARVDRRVLRRAMEVEHAAADVGHRRRRPLDRPARSPPRSPPAACPTACSVDEADRDHRVLAVEVDQPALAGDDVIAVVPIQRLQHRRLVVVPSGHVEPNARSAQPILGQLDPVGEPRRRELVEQAVLRQGIGLDGLVLVCARRPSSRSPAARAPRVNASQPVRRRTPRRGPGSWRGTRRSSARSARATLPIRSPPNTSASTP